MTEFVTAREATQNFSKILGKAAAGESIVITRRGAPVAELIRYRPEEDDRRRAAWARLLEVVDKGLDLNVGKFRRDDLYER